MYVYYVFNTFKFNSASCLSARIEVFSLSTNLELIYFKMTMLSKFLIELLNQSNLLFASMKDLL